MIHIKGVGKVKIGSCAETLSEYNHLSIDLDPTISEGEASEKLQILFAAIGLGAVSSSSRAEDVERIKTLQLFRAFYPRQAYQFEKNPQTFEESIESLKRRISNQVPDMMGKFTHYLINHPEDMYQQEVYPGQKVWAVRGISKAVKKAGGIGLMAGVTASDFYDATGRLVSLLKSGALSTQDRFQLGIIAGGASSQEDLITGGAGSVFLRMVTNNMPKELDTYPLAGHIQILYDLDLVERVGYAYSQDLYGSKTSTAYQNRLNIINLTTQINTHPLNHLDNEICINHRVGPEFIKGLLVKSEKEKQQLIVVLKHKGLTTKNASHQDCFNGIPLDQFIRVGIARPDYWN